MKFKPLAVLLASILPPLAASGGRVTIDGYAAMVNDRVITIGDVLEYIQPMEEQMRREYSGAQLENRLHEAFEAGRQTLIEQALVLEDFRLRGYEMPERAVDERAEMIIHERFQGDRSGFLALLAREGMTLEQWREGLREQLIFFRMRFEAMGDPVAVSPKEVRAAYEADLERHRTPPVVRLRMIVIHGSQVEEHDAIRKEEAEKVRSALVSGADFENMAREHSEGPHAHRGGDAGWVQPGDLREELRAALAGLEVGETSGLVKAGGSYYILRLEGRRDERITPFEEVKEIYEEELIRAEEERRYLDWMQRLRQRHFVREF